MLIVVLLLGALALLPLAIPVVLWRAYRAGGEMFLLRAIFCLVGMISTGMWLFAHILADMNSDPSHLPDDGALGALFSMPWGMICLVSVLGAGLLAGLQWWLAARRSVSP